MQQTDSLNEFRHIVEQRQGRTQIINYVSSILLLILFVWAALSWWNNRISISNLHIVGESELCGGDWLIVAYDLYVNGTGVLVRDASTERVSPPRTVIFSEPLRYSVTGPIREQVIRAWQVPREFLDFETGRMAPLPPGEYLRNVSVSSPGRSDTEDTESALFSIRSGCPQ